MKKLLSVALAFVFLFAAACCSAESAAGYPVVLLYDLFVRVDQDQHTPLSVAKTDSMDPYISVYFADGMLIVSGQSGASSAMAAIWMGLDQEELAEYLSAVCRIWKTFEQDSAYSGFRITGAGPDGSLINLTNVKEAEDFLVHLDSPLPSPGGDEADPGTAELGKALTDAEAAAAKAEAEKKALQDRITELEDTIARMTEDKDSAAAKAGNDMEALLEKNAQLDKAVEEAYAAVAKAEAEKKALQDRIAELEATMREADDIRDMANAELKTANDRIAGLEKAAEEAADAADKAAERETVLQDKLAEAEAREVDLQRRLDDALALITELEAAISRNAGN